MVKKASRKPTVGKKSTARRTPSAKVAAKQKPVPGKTPARKPAVIPKAKPVAKKTPPKAMVRKTAKKAAKKTALTAKTKKTSAVKKTTARKTAAAMTAAAKPTSAAAKPAAAKTIAKRAPVTKPSNRRTPAPQGSSSKKPAKVVPTLNLPRAKKKLYTERLMELHQSMFEEIKVHSDSALTFERQAGEELADIGSDSFQREMELGMMTSEEKRVQLIRDALERLQAGTYGVCLDCASPIPEGRLEALPYAKLCVGCKAEREEREAQGLATPDDLTE